MCYIIILIFLPRRSKRWRRSGPSTAARWCGWRTCPPSWTRTRTSSWRSSGRFKVTSRWAKQDLTSLSWTASRRWICWRHQGIVIGNSQFEFSYPFQKRNSGTMTEPYLGCYLWLDSFTLNFRQNVLPIKLNCEIINLKPITCQTSKTDKCWDRCLWKKLARKKRTY